MSLKVKPQNPETITPSINLLKFQKEAEKINIYPLSCDQNIEGNYDNYLNKTLSDLAILKKLRFEYAIEDPEIYKIFPNKDQIENLKNSKKKILLLDLDETLIHADFDNNYEKEQYDTIINFESSNEKNLDDDDNESTNDSIDNIISVGIILRPNVKQFLEKLSLYFEIGIFTASVPEYADAVINYLDPGNNFIKFRLYRNNCIFVNDELKIKDLRILKGVDLKNVVLVDNNMYSFAAQINNGILINSFYDNKKDNELLNVFGYLMAYIYNAEDVRKVNEEMFQFKKIRNEKSKFIRE